jgi:uncharacterized membrane protein
MNDPIDDMQNYKWNAFYYNPDDYRVIAPKRSRLGLTLNFARIESYLVLFITSAAAFLLSHL